MDEKAVNTQTNNNAPADVAAVDNTVDSSSNFNDYAAKKVINFETTPVVDVVNYILLTAAKKMHLIFILILLINI